jgi:hypothetical protein
MEATMLRKQVLPRPGARLAPPDAAEIPVAQVATVQVTSEQADHPIDHAFDGHRGPGGSRWVAEEPGEQTVVLVFDRPQTVRGVELEIEEPSVSRTQQLAVSLSTDGGRSYREVVRQEFNFSPPGTTFERERWSVAADGVTHLRLVITPDKSGRGGQATLTSLVVR